MRLPSTRTWSRKDNQLPLASLNISLFRDTSTYPPQKIIWRVDEQLKLTEWMLLKKDELFHRVRIKICLGYKGSTLRYVLRVIICTASTFGNLGGGFHIIFHTEPWENDPISIGWFNHHLVIQYLWLQCFHWPQRPEDRDKSRVKNHTEQNPFIWDTPPVELIYIYYIRIYIISTP